MPSLFESLRNSFIITMTEVTPPNTTLRDCQIVLLFLAKLMLFHSTKKTDRVGSAHLTLCFERLFDRTGNNTNNMTPDPHRVDLIVQCGGEMDARQQGRGLGHTQEASRRRHQTPPGVFHMISTAQPRTSFNGPRHQRPRCEFGARTDQSQVVPSGHFPCTQHICPVVQEPHAADT